uniref:Bm1138 n=1 Tax=Brugia malayi TaxID=6279 RepID=A0A0J9XN95_BRUMA|nr:Bm1138 [Brugia malayi]
MHPKLPALLEKAFLSFNLYRVCVIQQQGESDSNPDPSIPVLPRKVAAHVNGIVQFTRAVLVWYFTHRYFKKINIKEHLIK